MSILPVVALERLVMYRERAAGMYRPIHFHIASGVAELPYIITQSVLYSALIYWMVYFRPLVCSPARSISIGRDHSREGPPPLFFPSLLYFSSSYSLWFHIYSLC